MPVIGATVNDIYQIQEQVHGRSVANIRSTGSVLDTVIIGVDDPVDSTSIWLRDLSAPSEMIGGRFRYRDSLFGSPRHALITMASRNDDGTFTLTLDRSVSVAFGDLCVVIWPCAV